MATMTKRADRDVVGVPAKGVGMSHAGYPTSTPGGSRSGVQSGMVEGTSNRMLSGTSSNRTGNRPSHYKP